MNDIQSAREIDWWWSTLAEMIPEDMAVDVYRNSTKIGGPPAPAVCAQSILLRAGLCLTKP